MEIKTCGKAVILYQRYFISHFLQSICSQNLPKVSKINIAYKYTVSPLMTKHTGTSLQLKGKNTFFFSFVVLELELRAFTLSHLTSPFLCVRVFSRQGLMNYLSRLASNLYPPDLCLLRS
jgi:hypothetical protein